MTEKTPRLKPHTMTDLSRLGIKMYGPPPLNPDQQRRLGQVSFLEEEDPQFLADSMEIKDNPPDIAA